MRDKGGMSDVGDGIGTVAAGALIAREIERAHADRPAVGHADNEPCANCGAVRAGPYCHRCGQAGHVHRNLYALVHDVAHGVFHFEGRIWHTLPLLAWHPGRLTRRYVDGERAKFVSPMALFLFSVFLMFAVVSNLAGHGRRGDLAGLVADGGELDVAVDKASARMAALRRQRAATRDAAARAAIDAQLADAARELTVVERLDKAGLGSPGREAEGPGRAALSRADVHTGWDFLDEAVVNAARNPELLLYKMKSYAYKYSWALIPISLPFIWLLFAFRRDVGLYDHAIFSIYSLSFMSLGVVLLTVASLIGAPTAIVALAAMFVPPIHMYRQLKGAYRLGRFGAGWRTMALLCVTVVTSLLFLTFLFYLGSD